jgi:hypothetical protein
MKTTSAFLTLLGAFALVTLVSAAIPRQDHSHIENPKWVYHAGPPTTPLPNTLKPDEFAQDAPAFTAYALAAKVKLTLYQVPCYCPCDKLKGHTSLLDCFTSKHGAQCRICQQEAIFCYLRRREPLARLRARIANGDAWNVDLSQALQLLNPKAASAN